uniref:Sec-independent protein translocase protein TatB n=1 Tax=uncultured Cardiobacterium sp. TaxID=417619 RepID=UPI00260B129F
MFDIGFSELVVLGVIGIVVIGPQRLPEVVRTAVITVRKIRRAFSDVRADIERELDLDDMRK